MRRAVLHGLCAISLCVSGALASAQTTDYPNRPIRVVVPYAPGGTDHQIRALAPTFARLLGQSLVIENREGGGATVGTALVKQAKPDGYTLLLSPAAIMTITPYVRKAPYNPDDLMAVTRLSTSLLSVTITNKLGAATWPEFVALARKHPGEYWYGSSGLGTVTHLTGEVLTRTAGIRMQHSPYKTIVDAVGDLFNGRIQMVFDPSFVPYAKAGKCRVVLTDGPTRNPELPDVPTARELGLDLKGFRDRSWFGLFAPKGTPMAVAQRLSDEAAKAAADPDIQRKVTLVAQAAHHQSPQAFAAQVASDRTFFAGLIKELDIKLE